MFELLLLVIISSPFLTDHDVWPDLAQGFPERRSAVQKLGYPCEGSLSSLVPDSKPQRTVRPRHYSPETINFVPFARLRLRTRVEVVSAARRQRISA